jgi:HD-GYP domain-containing protein (c-di-GMP phosphodiesterase class II)
MTVSHFNSLLTGRLMRMKFKEGQRLPFDVFDRKGKLLLLRGGLITDSVMVEELVQNGRARESDTSRVSVFEGMTRLVTRLRTIFDDVRCESVNGILSRRVGFLAEDLIDLVDRDPDAAFASIHLNLHHGYIVLHSMMAGVVAYRLALASGFSLKERIALICAALTHDLGLLRIEDIVSGSESLDLEQRKIVKQHVENSIQILIRYGIDDPLWLRAVRDHHEFLDGSGYTGKAGDDLSVEARIMALADSYSAMLRPRPYRDRVLASHALEDLYANQLDRYDGPLLESLIWDFGFQPPGSVLRLLNREMAVAVRNTPGILDRPIVASLTDAQGRPYGEPVFRDANDPKYGICEVLDPAMYARAGHYIERCWSLN